MTTTAHEQHDEMPEGDPTLSRRTVLKVVAGAPLVLAFGLLASPLARFLKPTMKPGGFFQAADLPCTAYKIQFNMRDFPSDWTCIPFLCDMKYVVFNPEKEQIRSVPGFAVRTAPDEIVAFSRICPRRGCILNFQIGNRCGCAAKSGIECCGCGQSTSDPVLACPNGHLVFDLARRRGLKGICPRQFNTFREGDFITINGFEFNNIA